MKFKSALLTALLGLGTIESAVASGFEIGVGYAGYENPADIDDSKGIKLNMGYRFENGWGLELSHAYIDGVVENNGEERFSHDSLNLLYHFGERAVQAYILGGVGGYEGNGAASAAFGLKFRMGRVELRPEVGAVNSFSESNGDETLNAMASLSMSILFGSRGASVPEAPKVIETKLPEKPPDADEDGVLDANDNCAETPAGAPVDTMGCPLDGDNDGVIDYFDRCPDSDMTLKMDDQGCPVKLMEDVSIDLHVHFDSGSSVVKAEFYPEIAKAGKFLEQYPGTNVVIEGHTDSSGSAELNKRLSEKRAAAVADVLVNIFKVSSDRVSSRGYGESRPIADNSTRAGQVANRRVVATIKAEIEKFEKK